MAAIQKQLPHRFSFSCQGLPPSGKAAVWGVGSSNHFNSFPLSDTSEEPAASTASTCLSLGDLHNLHVLLFIMELDGSWKVFFLLNPGPAIHCTTMEAAIKVRGRTFFTSQCVLWVSEQLLMFFPFCFQWLQLPHWKCSASCILCHRCPS